MILRAIAAVALFMFSTVLTVSGQSFSLSKPHIGFGDTYRSGSWAPLSTRVQTSDSAPGGEIRLSVTDDEDTQYRIVRDLQSGTSEQQQLEFIIPVPDDRFSVAAQLYADGKQRWSRTWQFDAPELPRRLVLAVARKGSLEPLTEAHGTLADDARIVHITPDELPRNALGYDAVDTVLLYDAAPAEVSPAAVSALERWTRRGGQVITVGGVHLRPGDTEQIKRLLPGSVSGFTRGMPSSWNVLFPLGISGSASTIYSSAFDPSASARTVPAEGPPLISYQERGKGSIAFVATDLQTLSRIAMRGSGLWREAFPPLSQTGRIRFPTNMNRQMHTTPIGNAAIIDAPPLVPRRATVTIVGLLYVIAIAVVTHLIARGYRPPRAAVLVPALAATALAAALLFGAERGSWTPPAFVAKGELFRGTAPGHDAKPSPGVLQTDLLIISRTGAEVELTLGNDLHPIPLRRRSVTVYENRNTHTLKPEIVRGGERNYYIQSSMSLPMTAELALSSRGVRLSLSNGTDTRIEDAYVLWNNTVFRLGSMHAGGWLSKDLTEHMSAAEIRRRIPADRAAALRNISRRSVSGAEPALLVFMEQPFERLTTPPKLHSHSFSAGLLSLQHPSAHRVAGSGNPR
ncbi:MAG: hypothetical protein R6V29_12625 [Spirochaetia bacterium]